MMIIRFAALAAVISLTGCSGTMKLLEDGKSHSGTWSGFSKTIDVTIDGDKYTGQFTRNATVGFGQAFGGGAVYGAKPVTFNTFGTGTSVSSNGTGQAVLYSEKGKVIQCNFHAAFGNGQGQCEGLDGRRFVLVIN